MFLRHKWWHINKMGTWSWWTSDHWLYKKKESSKTKQKSNKKNLYKHHLPQWNIWSSNDRWYPIKDLGIAKFCTEANVEIILPPCRINTQHLWTPPHWSWIPYLRIIRALAYQFTRVQRNKVFQWRFQVSLTVPIKKTVYLQVDSEDKILDPN